MIKKEYEIKTERLILRPLELNDLDTTHEYASNIENTKYMVFLPNNSIKETEQFLQRVVAEWEKDSPRFYEFAITLNGEQIGAISVALDKERTTGVLGWIINKKYWKKGYATEAVVAIKDFAIKELKVLKLTANCDYRNVNSYRLMERIGLQLESDSGIRTYPKTSETVKELIYSLIIDQT